RRRHTRFSRDWSSDVCSSDLGDQDVVEAGIGKHFGLGDLLAVETGCTGFHLLAGNGGDLMGLDMRTECLAVLIAIGLDAGDIGRSEERRVGEEGGWRVARLRE